MACDINVARHEVVVVIEPSCDKTCGVICWLLQQFESKYRGIAYSASEMYGLEVSRLRCHSLYPCWSATMTSSTSQSTSGGGNGERNEGDSAEPERIDC